MKSTAAATATNSTAVDFHILLLAACCLLLVMLVHSLHFLHCPGGGHKAFKIRKWTRNTDTRTHHFTLGSQEGASFVQLLHFCAAFFLSGFDVFPLNTLWRGYFPIHFPSGDAIPRYCCFFTNFRFVSFALAAILCSLVCIYFFVSYPGIGFQPLVAN